MNCEYTNGLLILSYAKLLISMQMIAPFVKEMRAAGVLDKNIVRYFVNKGMDQEKSEWVVANV